jgi:hypothetical protein
VKPPFQLREAPTAEILELLAETTLGTSGARYQHLDVLERVHSADQPLYLSVERAQKVLGNITFCRRGNKWYIRYWITQFFEDTFNGKYQDQKVHLFYAYIDPKNERSKSMSANFGFHVAGNLVTQSFSRVHPKSSSRILKIERWEEVSDEIQHRFSKYQHYDEAQLKTPPFYVLLNTSGEHIACAHITKVRWKIERLPGKIGGLLTKVVPFVPFLRILIKPNDHQFLVPDCVWTKDDNSELLEELFSAILFEEKMNLMLWWMDKNDPLYLGVKNKLNWGLLHKIIGVSPVDIVVREKKTTQSKQPFFVCAWDMV